MIMNRRTMCVCVYPADDSFKLTNVLDKRTNSYAHFVNVTLIRFARKSRTQHHFIHRNKAMKKRMNVFYIKIDCVCVCVYSFQCSHLPSDYRTLINRITRLGHDLIVRENSTLKCDNTLYKNVQPTIRSQPVHMIQRLFMHTEFS